MKRILSACLVLVLLVSHGMPAAAQTPVATPDPFALPVNHLLLRITEGNGYEYLIDETGVLVYGNVYLVRHGEIPEDIPPGLEDIYTRLGVQHIYYMYVVMMPEDRAADSAQDVGITIEMRLITLEDGDSAAELVALYPDIIADAGEAPSMIPDPPEHDGAIVGVTGMEPYINLASGRPTDIEVPYARFIAQHGTTVASAKVSGLDPTFNDAVARELLSAQLGCLEANEFCVPMPLPGDIPYEPGTPVASPAAWRSCTTIG